MMVLMLCGNNKQKHNILLRTYNRSHDVKISQFFYSFFVELYVKLCDGRKVFGGTEVDIVPTSI